MASIYIDAENVPYNRFDSIKEKCMINNIHPIMSIKVYADWSRDDMQPWYELCKKYSIDQKQCTSRPKKNVVDFHICIDIMDDIYTDILNKTLHLKKIVIVSTDSDFIHIHNRINKFNISATVYSPFEDKMELYKNHNNLFEENVKISHKPTEEDLTEKMYDENNSYYKHYFDSDQDESDDSDYETDDSDDNEEMVEYLVPEDRESIKRNIQLCFNWFNKKKNPNKKIKLTDFKETFNQLSNDNLMVNVDDYNTVDSYFETNLIQIIDGYVEMTFPPIKFNTPIIHLVELAFLYKNAKRTEKKIRHMKADIKFLRDKNIVDHHVDDKDLNKNNIINTIKYQFYNNMYINKNTDGSKYIGMFTKQCL